MASQQNDEGDSHEEEKEKKRPKRLNFIKIKQAQFGLNTLITQESQSIVPHTTHGKAGKSPSSKTVAGSPSRRTVDGVSTSTLLRADLSPSKVSK